MTEPNENVGTHSVTRGAEIVRKRAEKEYPCVFAELRAEKEEAIKREGQDATALTLGICLGVVSQYTLGEISEKAMWDKLNKFKLDIAVGKSIVKSVYEAADKAREVS